MNRFLDFNKSEESLPIVTNFLFLGQNSNSSLRRITFLICELYEINSCLEILARNKRYSLLLDQPGQLQSLHALLNKLSDKVQRCLDDAVEEDQRRSLWTHANVTASGLLTPQRSVRFREENEIIQSSMPKTRQVDAKLSNITEGPRPSTDNSVELASRKRGCFSWPF